MPAISTDLPRSPSRAETQNAAVLATRFQQAFQDGHRLAIALYRCSGGLAGGCRGGESGTDDVAEVDVTTFLTLTLTNIVAGLGDLKQLTESLAVGMSTPDACHLLQCPWPVQLRRAVQDAIEVLEHTKGHFKPKDLGALRGRLEAVLDNT